MSQRARSYTLTAGQPFARSLSASSSTAFFVWYIQLRNQLVIGIATSQLSAGDSLPSVRQLADRVGINMHTVNKAYTVLRQEGYVKLDRRKGAVIAIDCNKASARNKLLRDLQVMLAGAMCKGITRDEVHEMIDMIYDYYEQPANYPEEG